MVFNACNVPRVEPRLHLGIVSEEQMAEIAVFDQGNFEDLLRQGWQPPRNRR